VHELRTIIIGVITHVRIWSGTVGIVQVCLWFGFLSVVGYLVFRNRFSATALFLFVTLFTGGQAAYYLGYIGYDYVLTFYVFFLLCLSLFSRVWPVFYCSALSLSGLLLLIKFSSAILAILSLLGFLFVVFFTDRRKALRALGLTLILPLFFIVSFMMYHPSFAAISTYLKGAYELVAGYSIAMSKPGNDSELVLAFLTVVFFALFMVTLYAKKEKCFYIAGAFIAPLWFSFKHGFVRQDTHVLIFFSTALFLVGLMMLFSDVRIFIKRALGLTIAFAGVWLMVFIQHVPADMLFRGVGGLITLNNMKAAMQYAKTKQDLHKVSSNNLKSAQLPHHFLERIGSRRFGIFPWEISYVASHNVNFVPFPVFQADNAYTANLDERNAQFVDNTATAPEFLLMEWKSVDGRHPLIDVPALWLSLYKWYDRDADSSALLLLKRRPTARFTRLNLVERNDCDRDAFITIPTYLKPVIMKIYLNLNFVGRLSKISFRIEETRIALQTDSGGIHSFRVVPDTLRNGLLIHILPMHLQDVELLLGNSPVGPKIKGFRLYGNGLRAYENRMTVEFYVAGSD